MALFVLAVLFFVNATVALASGPVSPHYSHPLDWMYQLPVGEAPGWTSPVWANLEASESNVWNRPMTVVDRATGRVYTYEADYQASIVVLDVGAVVWGDSLAFGVELPYMRRHGGNSDQFISDWHKMLDFYNYQRERYPNNRTVLDTTVDGQVLFSDTAPADGLSSVKLKLKYRLLEAGGSRCPCGLAVSLQSNLPVNGARKALSSGAETYSVVFHAGIPLGSESAMYITTGASQIGPNPVFAEWPMNRQIFMGDLAFDIGLGGGLGFIGSASAYSRWMQRRLEFVPESADVRQNFFQRLSSGYNALFRLRGYQNYGVRYRWGASGSQIALFIFEDFGMGDYDGRRDITYTNNAPDVLIGTQLSLRY